MNKSIILEHDAIINYIDNTITVVSACPINMSTVIEDAEDHSMSSFVGNITWLCKTSDGNLICIRSGYTSNSDKDDEFFTTIPFLEENNFASHRLSYQMLRGTLPTYITDLELYLDYSIDHLYNGGDNEIYCIGVSKEDNKIEFSKSYISNNVFAEFGYMDSYMLCGSENYTMGLSKSIVVGTVGVPTKVIGVNNIKLEDVILVNSNTVIIDLIIDGENSSDKYSLLMPYDLNSKVSKRKLRKRSKSKSHIKIKSTKSYNGTISFDYKFDGIPYMFVFAHSYDEEPRLFTFNDSIKCELEDMIAEACCKSTSK